MIAVVPGYYLVCYNRERETLHNCKDYAGFLLSKKKRKSCITSIKIVF